MAEHALLSPSSAHRWLRCTAAPKFEAQFEDQSSEYAEEGTVAHAVAALVASREIGLISASEYKAELKKIQQKPKFEAEMLNHAKTYAAYIKEHHSGLAWLEQRLELAGHDIFGTADCVLVGDGELHIVDYKYGKGVEVEAERNDQLRIYALMAYEEYGDLYAPDMIRLSIVQPRIANGTKTWTEPIESLLKWAEEVLIPKANEAVSDKRVFAPSENVCRFCKAGSVCRARAKKNLDLFNAPEAMTVAEIAELLIKAGDIKSWISSMEAKVFDTLMTGAKVIGWKLVEGRSVRRYADETKVRKALNDAGFDDAVIYERQLLGISAMEKLMGKKAFAEILSGLIEKPQGKPTLAPESDARPAISIISEFDK